MEEEGNILKIMNQTKAAVRTKDVIKLKELSNQTIHTASITQDPDNLAVAVIVYSLGKIIERKQDKTSKGARFLKTVLTAMQDSIDAINEQDKEKLHKSIELMRMAVDKISGDFKNYIEDVFRKAKINKASKIYEHGISMEKTADLLGVTQYEIASYAGQKSTTSEMPETETISTKQRIKLVMEMFS